MKKEGSMRCGWRSKYRLDHADPEKSLEGLQLSF